MSAHEAKTLSRTMEELGDTENGWQARAYLAAGELWEQLVEEQGTDGALKAMFCRQALVIAQLERVAAWQEQTEQSVREFKTFIEGTPMFAMMKAQKG